MNSLMEYCEIATNQEDNSAQILRDRRAVYQTRQWQALIHFQFWHTI